MLAKSKKIFLFYSGTKKRMKVASVPSFTKSKSPPSMSNPKCGSLSKKSLPLMPSKSSFILLPINFESFTRKEHNFFLNGNQLFSRCKLLTRPLRRAPKASNRANPKSKGFTVKNLDLATSSNKTLERQLRICDHQVIMRHKQLEKESSLLVDFNETVEKQSYQLEKRFARIQYEELAKKKK